MSWPLFAVIQLALLTVGVVVVFALRNRELRRQLDVQAQEAAGAAELLEEAAERFESVAEEARDKWLVERAMEFDEDDPVQLVQKLVLQNEREPIPDFSDSLRRRISAGGEAREHQSEQWRTLRSEAYQIACGLIERFPRSYPVIVQVYESCNGLDEEYGVVLPPLPEPDLSAGDDDSADSEVAEHLRAANELLHQQLEDSQNELATLRASGASSKAQEEDLKALLQQFTRDSRDMMACIQELEQENQLLRERLGEAAGQEPPQQQAPSAEAGAAPKAGKRTNAA